MADDRFGLTKATAIGPTPQTEMKLGMMPFPPSVGPMMEFRNPFPQMYDSQLFEKSLDALKQGIGQEGMRRTINRARQDFPMFNNLMNNIENYWSMK